ncbi:hypothetical protein ACOJR9_14120 [Alteromonas sp. A081]|uniref:hypothetical protein n=1 Tax=Alteromonas sp. A081 TaxID=3410269 RepID=UPI003B983593
MFAHVLPSWSSSEKGDGTIFVGKSSDSLAISEESKSLKKESGSAVIRFFYALNKFIIDVFKVVNAST